MAVAPDRGGRDARPRLVDTFGWVAVRPGEPLAGDALTAAVEHADAVRGRLLRWFEPFDLLVSPVLPLPAVRHGESRTPIYGDTYSEIHNLTGWPAAVVRGGTSPEGLPIGVQLVAKPWREDVALAAARVVEAATGGWRRRRSGRQFPRRRTTRAPPAPARH